VVECGGFEIRYTGNRIGGSNPFLSAKKAFLRWEKPFLLTETRQRNTQLTQRSGRVVDCGGLENR
jgi:hypothetical protein